MATHNENPHTEAVDAIKRISLLHHPASLDVDEFQTFFWPELRLITKLFLVLHAPSTTPLLEKDSWRCDGMPAMGDESKRQLLLLLRWFLPVLHAKQHRNQPSFHCTISCCLSEWKRLRLLRSLLWQASFQFCLSKEPLRKCFDKCTTIWGKLLRWDRARGRRDSVCRNQNSYPHTSSPYSPPQQPLAVLSKAAFGSGSRLSSPSRRLGGCHHERNLVIYSGRRKVESLQLISLIMQFWCRNLFILLFDPGDQTIHTFRILVDIL